MDNRLFIAKRAARYFKSGDIVNLGVGIPSMCGNYAEPGVMFQTENGFIGVGPVAEGLMMNDGYYNAGGIPYIPLPGGCGFDSAMSFGIIRSGRMAATVLGALQVSVEGDLANWASQGRAFGMGGAMDLCNGARQVIVAMELTTKDGKPKIVNRCTFPLTAAEGKTPVTMGLVQSLGVFIDTIVICSCTAFIMLLVPQEVTDGLSGMALLQTAMEFHLGRFGVIFIAVTLAMFSFSTFLGILFYARSNVAYLFGDKWCWQTAYKVLALVMLFIGGIAAYTFVWDLGDVGIGLMTLFNISILYPLSKEAFQALGQYEKEKTEK